MHEEEKEMVEVDVSLDEEQSTEEQNTIQTQTEEKASEVTEEEEEVDEIELLRKSLKALFSDPEALIDQYVELYKELQETKAKRDEYLDLAQRTQANLENYRKQVQKDQKWANFHNKSKILEKFLSIYDDLARTKEEFNKKPDVDHAKEAIRMIFDNINATFENLGVTPINPKIGEEFDPRVHEAIHAVDLKDKPNNTIIEIVNLGFMLEDLVLRPAKVVIAKTNSNEKNKNNGNKNN
ncbi:MAG: nucleotide exchange factor GrpE [Candidatus Heimdallarchaeaceae archaeon]